MSEREHERSVQQALRTERELRLLFDRLGNRAHPRGRVLSAYRQARRALKGNTGDLTTVREILAELRWNVAQTAMDALSTASAAGSLQAKKTLAVYGLGNVYQLPDVSTELDAWLATVDAQSAAVMALAMNGDEMEILGDGERVGALSPSPVVREGARWLAVAALASVMVGIDAALSRNDAQDDFMRQAVAAIDERTTDCCLRVHGQVVKFDKRFTLTGTPRFADRVMAPPFHWYCRSSVALVRREDADDGLSRQMRSAAMVERDARAVTGRRAEIHPADARSTR